MTLVTELLRTTVILLKVQKRRLKCLTINFFSVFTKEDTENMPDKGQSPHRVMPTIDISLNGVIGCV